LRNQRQLGIPDPRRDGGREAVAVLQSGMSPLGVVPGSVGVLVPALTGPFTPPLEGVLVAEPGVEPDPVVSALPVIPDVPSALPAGIGTFGLVEFGEAL
jgi:hypothetical protein